MKLKYTLLTFLSLLLLVFSCKKKEDAPNNQSYYYVPPHWLAYPVPTTETFAMYLLAPDHAENMWYGGYHSLYKRTGLTVTDYSPYIIPSAPGSYYTLTALAVDNTDQLWIGFNNKGLIMYDGSSYHGYDTTNSGLTDQNIKNIVVDENNVKWFGADSSLIKYDGITWTTYNPGNSPLRQFNSLVCTPGNLWICGRYSLQRFDGTTFTSWDITNSGFPAAGVRIATKDEHGNIWFMANGPSAQLLYKFDGTNFVSYAIPRFDLDGAYDPSAYDPFSYLDIKADAQDNVWICGEGFLYKFNGISFTNITVPSAYNAGGPYPYPHAIPATLHKMVITSDLTKWFAGFVPGHTDEPLYSYK